MVKPKDLASSIRSVPDFPKKGIVFRDITTLLKDPASFKGALDTLADRYEAVHIDKIVGIESRGFIFGAALSDRLNVGFIPARKPGKLPAQTLKEEYELEYGRDSIEIHADAIKPGEHILIHDDLLATGGTAAATCRLVERMSGIIVGCSFLIELAFLNGRERLKGYDLFSIIQYHSE
ncbi:MAG TPA: adenine phosphoribosyltransferase [Bacteroidota bacterium]|nr:adenine phosphoribosyltransferase [Bacteroidota bacterium]